MQNTKNDECWPEEETLTCTRCKNPICCKKHRTGAGYNKTGTLAPRDPSPDFGWVEEDDWISYRWCLKCTEEMGFDDEKDILPGIGKMTKEGNLYGRKDYFKVSLVRD